MNIVADTNMLLRLFMDDDEAQSVLALEAMKNADLVAVSIHALCELAWVLNRHYGVPRPEIAAAVRTLVGTANVVVNRPLVEAGVAMLEAGGDFADGVIAHDGRWLGGEQFVSFDKKAVKRLHAQGLAARLLA